MPLNDAQKVTFDDLFGPEGTCTSSIVEHKGINSGIKAIYLQKAIDEVPEVFEHSLNKLYSYVLDLDTSSGGIDNNDPVSSLISPLKKINDLCFNTLGRLDDSHAPRSTYNLIFGRLAKPGAEDLQITDLLKATINSHIQALHNTGQEAITQKQMSDWMMSEKTIHENADWQQPSRPGDVLPEHSNIGTLRRTESVTADAFAARLDATNLIRDSNTTSPPQQTNQQVTEIRDNPEPSSEPPSPRPR